MSTLYEVPPISETRETLEAVPEVTVREAMPTEAMRVLALFRDWHQSAKADFPEINNLDALQWILQLFREGLILFAELNGGKYNKALAGVLALQFTSAPWNLRSRTLSDAFYYVPQAYSRWAVAHDLTQRAQKTARELGTTLALGFVNGAKTAQLRDWYGLKDFKYVGGMYRYTPSEEENHA